jgi:hypothetical protein
MILCSDETDFWKAVVLAVLRSGKPGDPVVAADAFVAEYRRRLLPGVDAAEHPKPRKRLKP